MIAFLKLVTLDFSTFANLFLFLDIKEYISLIDGKLLLKEFKKPTILRDPGINLSPENTATTINAASKILSFRIKKKPSNLKKINTSKTNKNSKLFFGSSCNEPE